MGGGARFPYPREVWSPAGGWWSRPKNWGANTAICGVMILGVAAVTWNFSAKREYRTMAPTRQIPSQRWSPQAKELGVREGYE